MALGALRTRPALAKAKGLVPRRLGADSGPGSKQQLEKVRPRAPNPPPPLTLPRPRPAGSPAGERARPLLQLLLLALTVGLRGPPPLAERAQVLGALDLTLLGIGGIVGAGLFVLTGVVAHNDAGPAVMVSYAVAALVALVCALCYTEFAVDMPVTGGAYNYIVHTFGELLAWLVAWNLLLEYTLSVSAVARGFTSYFATAVGLRPDDLRVPVGPVRLDFPALGSIGLLCALLAYGTRESARFNSAVTGMNLVVICFIMGVGFPLGFKASTLTPFAPMKARGVFGGASRVFFSFVGFDTLATAAEEVKNPAFDLPVGILGSIGICAVLYAAMSLVICGMVPYQDMDMDAPFSQAFVAVGQGWAAQVVSVGAVTGIVTSMMVSLIGATRIYVVLGRERLCTPWFAAVHAGRNTPVNAVVAAGLTSGALAFVVDIEALADLVSIGTLFVAVVVAGGILMRRYTMPDQARRGPIHWRLLALVAASLGFSTTGGAAGHDGPVPWGVPLAFFLAIAAVTASFAALPKVGPVPKFAVPLTPYVPCLAIWAGLHLICSLGWKAYVRFVVWVVLGVFLYVTYGVVHTAGSGAEAVAGAGGMQMGEVVARRDSNFEGTSLLEAGEEKSDLQEVGLEVVGEEEEAAEGEGEAEGPGRGGDGAGR